jgi:isopenicillin N synthase-like dioxygenase
VHKATRSNQNESFFVTHDRGPDHPDVIAEKPLRGRNQWPPGLPSLRADMMAYFAALSAMCNRMLPAFAVALGLSPNYFAPYFANEAHANLRFLHYPPQDTVEDNSSGQAPHTDNSFMTALARTEVPGLAVRLPSGEWYAPPIIPGAFLINLGNIMRRWSNDRFLSTPRGVINESGTDRIRSPISTVRTRTLSSSASPPALASTIRRAIRQPFSATLFSNSTGPITSTKRVTAAAQVAEGGGLAHKSNRRPFFV